MPLSLRTMIVRLPRRFSPKISTVPSISAMTAGSFGLRASKISVTRGRPPVMSCVPATSRGVLAKRSEEHTSELQSLRHLVCRLLLEKKEAVSNNLYQLHHAAILMTQDVAVQHVHAGKADKLAQEFHVAGNRGRTGPRARRHSRGRNA